jgi:3',5'-cyclic AMP phosphodiesterase CpdA
MRAAIFITALVLGAHPAAPGLAEADGPGKSLALHLSPFRYLVPAFGVALPAGWMETAFDDSKWSGPGVGPFLPRPREPIPGVSLPAGATLYEPVPHTPLYLRARFDADPRARVLELRIAYGDGFIAWVNGREVARRGIGTGPLASRPSEPHGPEVEHVYIPVSSQGAPSLAPTGNVLALEVRAFPGASAAAPVAPAAAVDLVAASGVRIVRGPYLISPAETEEGASLQVAWETDLPATGDVTVEPGQRRIASGPVATRQVVTLAGLERGRKLSYRVNVEASPGDRTSSGPHAFETLPPPPRPLRFAVYGDMRYPGHDAHRAVVGGLVREAPALVFNTGDLTDIGSEESNWQRYFEITARLGAIAPVIPALGNHDAARFGRGAARSWGLFGLPSSAPPGTAPGWTSLDLGGVHFIVLNTNEMTNHAQLEWLREDLARARARHVRAIFAFCHEGPWSHGLHGEAPLMISDYAPLLAAAKVDVLFSGHDHMYERGVGVTPSGNLPYVVTGGGGAPLYDPTCRARTGPLAGNVPPGLPLCPPSVAALVKTYHYLIVEVDQRAITICPRHPDGSPVEPCVRLEQKK